MGATFQQDINVRINAAISNMPAVQTFLGLLQKLKEHGNQKINIGGDAGQVGQVNHLAGAIGKLTDAVDKLDEGKLGKVRNGLHSVLLVMTALGSIPAAFDGLKTLRSIAEAIPGVAGRIAGAGTAIHGFFSLAREKIGGAADAVKGKVASIAESLPQFAKRLGGAAAGLLGVGAAGGIAAGALAIFAAAAVAAIAAVTGGLVLFVALGKLIFGLEQTFATTGSAIHDVAQQMGVTAEVASTLKFAAEQSGQSVEDLGRPISKFSVLVGEAARQSKSATETLRRFGIDPKSAIDDLDGALGKVFKKIYDAPTGVARATLANDAFGKSGSKLIPIIETMNGDFAEFKRLAEEAGAVMKNGDAEAADRLGDAFDRTRSIVAHLGNVFAAGVAPEITDGLNNMSDAMRRNEDAARSWGESTGDVVHALRLIFDNELGAMIGKLAEFSATYLSLTGLILKGLALFGRAEPEVGIEASFGAGIMRKRRDDDIFSPSGGGKSSKSGSPRAEIDTSGSQFALDKAQLEAEFDLLSDALDRENKLVREKYEDRKVSIAEYYSEQLRIQREKLDDELERLTLQLNAEEVRLTTALARIDADRKAGAIKTDVEAEAKKENETNQVRAQTVQLEAQRTKLERDRAALPHDLDRKQAADLAGLNQQLQKWIDEVDRMKGIGAFVEATNQVKELDQAIKALKLNRGLFENPEFAKSLGLSEAEVEQIDLFKRLGLSVDEVIKKLLQYRTNLLTLGTVQGEIDGFQKSRILNEARIVTLEEQGNRNMLTRYLANRQIVAIKKQELAEAEQLLRLLRSIGKEETNPEILARIEGVRTRIAQLQNETKSYKDTIKDTFVDALGSGLENLFMSLGDIISGTKSVGDAFREMALSIIQSLEQIIAKMLVMLIIKKLLGAFAGGVGDVGSAGSEGFASGLGGFAAGDFFAARSGGRIIRVAEGGHDEVVLTTDPKHRNRTVGLLAAFLNRTKLLGEYAAGAYFRADGFLDRIPRFEAGDFVTAGGPPAGWGGPMVGKVELHQHFPGVRNHRDFKLNQAAAERDAARAVRSGLERFRK